jgi:hypothetical protein
VVINGLAAGSAWLTFDVLDGPLTGKRLNMECERHRALYTCGVVTDDGFKINGDDLHGDLVPELDKEIFELAQ